MSDWFYQLQNRPHVVALFDFDEGDLETPEIIADLHQRFNVILRIINSRDYIKVPEFREFCIETNLIMVTELPCMDPNKTVHKFIGHAWEDILRNGSQGLGKDFLRYGRNSRPTLIFSNLALGETPWGHLGP